MKRASDEAPITDAQPPVLARTELWWAAVLRNCMPQKVAGALTARSAIRSKTLFRWNIFDRGSLQLLGAVPTMAASLCRLIRALFCTFAAGCAAGQAPAPGFQHFEATPDTRGAGYGAWYGDSDGETLYFGESAFWAAMRGAAGDPTADLKVAGKKGIGRFNLAGKRMEPPLEVKVAGGSGVWDVLARFGRVYFTTYFGFAGSVEPVSGTLTVFDDLGLGLNELAPGPDGSLLASRYGSVDGAPGSVVRFTPTGELLAEHPLDAPEGLVAAPKTVAWDPVRREIWVTVDLVSRKGAPAPPDARRLGADGREIERISEPEIQFVAFAADGTGYLASRTGSVLELLVLEPGMTGSPLASARHITLDREFSPDFDFVQDIHPASDGRVVLTRWSGKLHVAEPGAGRFETVDFPRDGRQGLYYSGVLAGRRLCATYCAGVEVVCTELP